MSITLVKSSPEIVKELPVVKGDVANCVNRLVDSGQIPEDAKIYLLVDGSILAVSCKCETATITAGQS